MCRLAVCSDGASPRLQKSAVGFAGVAFGDAPVIPFRLFLMGGLFQIGYKSSRARYPSGLGQIPGCPKCSQCPHSLAHTQGGSSASRCFPPFFYISSLHFTRSVCRRRDWASHRCSAGTTYALKSAAYTLFIPARERSMDHLRGSVFYMRLPHPPKQKGFQS